MLDLHLHLDGSLSPGLVWALAREQGVELPVQGEEQVKALLSVPAQCRSLNDYLACFDWPLLVLQSAEALERASYDLGMRLAKEGLLYAEIRFAPQLHTRCGLQQQQAVEAVGRGIQAACRASEDFYAQMILCCMRGAEEKENLETLQAAFRFLGEGVCGADLAGAEALYPTAGYRSLFQAAASMGIPFTIHAGEADGSGGIRDALSFGASRIGHGVRCVEDPALVEQLAAEGIPLELCLTSNLQTKAVRSPEEYPLRYLLRRGVRVTLNTDNMTVSGVTLAGEYKAMAALGLTQEEKLRLLENGAQAAFLSAGKKAELLEKIQRKSRAWPA